MGDVEDMFQYLIDKFDEIETLSVIHEDPSIVQTFALTIAQRIEAGDKKSIYKELEASSHDSAKALQFAALCIHFPAVAFRLMHFLHNPPKKGHRNTDYYKPLIYSRACSLKIRLENDNINGDEFKTYKKTWEKTQGSGKFTDYIEGLGNPLISKEEAIQKLKDLRHSDKDCVERAFRTFNIDISILNN